jgi:type I restriction enzyme S subunit
MPQGWVLAYLESVTAVLDSMRRPINTARRNERIKGKPQTELFPYYGATGRVGYIDDFIFDGEYILLGEDGVSFLDKNADKSYIISGKTWVNNHAHVLEAKIDIEYLCHALNAINYESYVNGTTRLKLTLAYMNHITLPVPPLAEQRRIVVAIETAFTELESIAENLS